MFGVPSWKNDEEKRGPQFEELCKSMQGSVEEEAIELKDGDVMHIDVYAAWAYGLELIGGRGDLNVAVLVGNSDESEAISHKTIDALSRLDSVNTVLTLNCPSMKKFNEFSSAARRVSSTLLRVHHQMARKSTQ